MQISEIVHWIGAICWIVSAICVAYVGVEYQIKYGFFRSIGVELNEKDKRLLKIAAILFFIGLFFFLFGVIFSKN